MSLARIVLLLLAVLATPARAGTVSIVVTGDPELQATLSQQLEAWLRGHGHTLGEALPADAISSLMNCMVIDDEPCARAIVDTRAKTDSVVFAEVRSPRTRSSNATTLIVYWLVKDKAPVGMRRSCEDCSPDLLRSTLDEMLRTVVGASELERGRLVLASRPEGLTVMLDNENIGITPLEREVPAGSHTIVLMSRGRKVGERTLNIHPQVTAEITMTAEIPPDEPVVLRARSRVLPGAALGLGGAAIAAGVILYFTSEVDDGTTPTYRDTKPLGIGLAAGGVVLAAMGAWLWLRTETPDSAPIIAIDRNAGMVGWTRAF